MLCCAVGVAAVATGAIGWRRFRRFFFGRLTAQSVLAAAVVMMGTMTAAALAVEHFSHHAAHASGSGMALLAGAEALPLCRSSAPSDRITHLQASRSKPWL